MNLMEEYKQIESDSLYLKNRSTFFASSTLTDPAMYRSHLEWSNFAACRGAISMLPINAGISSKQRQTNYHPWLKIPERKEWHLDLQLPADEFISLINDDLQRSQSWRNPFEYSCRPKTPLHAEKVSDFKDTKLCLGIRDGMIKKSEHGKKKVQVIPHDVIDLEDPNFSLPSEKQRCAWFSGVAPSSFTPGAKRHLGHDVTDSRCVTDIGPGCFRQMPFSSGFRRQQTELSTPDISNKKELLEMQSIGFSNKRRLPCLSRNTIDLDLNLPQVDTSLSLSDNSTVLNFVSVLSAVSHPVNATVSLHDAAAKCSMKSNGDNKIQGNSRNEAYKCRGANSSKLEIIDLGSPSGSTPDGCEGLSTRHPEHKNESAGSVSEHPDGLSFAGVEKDVGEAKLKLDKTAEDSVSMYPCQVPTESDSQSGVDWGDLHCDLGKVYLGSNVEESAPGEPDQRSLGTTESRNGCSDEKEEAVEVDELVQAAAEAMVCISSHILGEHQVCVRSWQLQDGENGAEHSSPDSYELVVLQQRESDPGEYEVSSQVVVGSEVPEKGGSPHKLKRGTRMRDFQKDILPALSSLLRHEIYEDVSILGNAVRSRDYKKGMRSKMGEKDTWCASNRSRRSRTNYRRRYYA